MELTGVTERKKSELDFTWKITDFDWICQKQSQGFQMVHSPEFVTGTEAGKKSTWQMYIKGENGFLCLFLVLRKIEASDGKTNNTVTCAFRAEVGMVDEKKPAFATSEMEDTFEVGSAAAELLSIPIRDVWSKSGKFVHNNILKIRLQLVIISEPISTIIEPNQLFEWNPTFGVSPLEMQGMGINYPASDVRIKCGNRIFHAHRSVLSFKSRVLAAILKSSTGSEDDHADSSFLGAEGLRVVEDNAKKLVQLVSSAYKNFAQATKNSSHRRQSRLQSPSESPSSKPDKSSSSKTTTAPDVLVDDLDPFTMELVLRFIYSGNIHPGSSSKINDTTKFWSELLYAAGKFELTDLKNIALDNILCSQCCRESKNVYNTIKAIMPFS